ncbi:cell division protein FtsQ/DivIB [Nesterenkonia lutea]|uniref:Cell division protein FtsQ n=1 Tax=Nesterenkonia lutea TaxID=272919 RepID=A0ABR9JE74_9MICC|nr:cell division protein FtsQ/DivIB [Nesterenkonia lutea]MBE1524228.1 cell division protein FtsQ [Nesterenkonia lutea]
MTRRGRRSSVDGPKNEPADSADLENPAETPLDFPEPASVSSRRRRRRGALLGLITLAVLLGIVAMLYFSPLLVVRTITLEDNELLTEQRAQELLEPLRGTPLPQVSDGDVSALLNDEHAVAEVIVAAELPTGLQVRVIEHPPVAEVHDGDEIHFYSQEGEVIRTFEDWERPDAQGYATPVISAEAALQNESVFKTIVSVLGQLPEGARESLDSATAESRDSVQLQLQDGRTVVWGSDDRGQEKAVVLEAILASEAEDFEEADVLDISTPSAPVTR